MENLQMLTGLSAGVAGVLVGVWWRRWRARTAKPDDGASRGDGMPTQPPNTPGAAWVKIDAEKVWAKETWGLESACELEDVHVISVVVQPGPKGVRRTMNFRARGMGNCSFALEAEGYGAGLRMRGGWWGSMRQPMRRLCAERRRGDGSFGGGL